MDKCSINGVSYKLILKSESQCKKLKKVDGYCDTTKKEIVIRNPNGMITKAQPKWWLNRLVHPVVKREFDIAFEFEIRQIPTEAKEPTTEECILAYETELNTIYRG